MNTNTIRVDKDELEKQITELENLCSDNQLSQKVTSIQNSIVNSSGSSADYVKCLNNELNELDKQMQTLFTRTLGLLKNTNTTFIQADEDLAEKIKKGEEK